MTAIQNRFESGRGPRALRSSWSSSFAYVQLQFLCVVLLLLHPYFVSSYAVRRWRPVTEFYNMSVTLLDTGGASGFIYGLSFDAGSGKAFGCYLSGTQRLVRLDSMTTGTPTVLGTATSPAAVAIDTRLKDALYVAGGSNKIEALSNPLLGSGQTLSTVLGGATSGYVPGVGTAARMQSPDGMVIAARMINGTQLPMLFGSLRARSVIFVVNINAQELSTFAGTLDSQGTVDGHRIDTARLRSPYGLAFSLDRSVLYFTQSQSTTSILRKIALDLVMTVILLGGGSTDIVNAVMPHPYFPNVTFFGLSGRGMFLHLPDDSLYRSFIPGNTPYSYNQVWNSSTGRPQCTVLNEVDGSILYGTLTNPGTFVRICCLWTDEAVEYTDPKDFNAMAVVPVLEGPRVSQVTYLPSRNWLVYAHYTTGLVWGIAANGTQTYITDSSGEAIYGVTVHPNGNEVFIGHEREVWRARIGINSTRWIGNGSRSVDFIPGVNASAVFGTIALISTVVNRSLFFADRSMRVLAAANIDTGEVLAYACPSMINVSVDGPRLSSTTGCKGIRDVTVTISGVIYMSDYFGNIRKVADGFVATILNAGYRGETSGIHPYFDLTYFVAEAIPNSVLYFHSGVQNYYFNCSGGGSISCSNRATVAAASLGNIENIYVPTSVQFPNGTYFVAGYVDGTGYKLFRVCCLWTPSKVQYLARQNVASVNVSVKAEVSGSWRLAYNDYYRAIYLFGSTGLIQHSPSSRTVLSASFDLSVSFPVWDAAGAVLYYTVSTGLKGISSSGSQINAGGLLVGQSNVATPFTDGLGSSATVGYGQLARSGAYLYVADRVNSVIGLINLTAVPSSYSLTRFACDNTSTGTTDGLWNVAQCQNLTSIQASYDLTTVYFAQLSALRKVRDGWVSSVLYDRTLGAIADAALISHPYWDQVVFFANSTNVGVVDASFFRSFALPLSPSGPLNALTGTPLPSSINITGMALLGEGGEIILTAVALESNKTKVLKVCCLWSGDTATATATPTTSITLSLSTSLSQESFSATESTSLSAGSSSATMSPPSASESLTATQGSMSSTSSPTLSISVTVSESFTLSLSVLTPSFTPTLSRWRRRRTRTHTGSPTATTSLSIPTFTESWSQTVSYSPTMSLSAPTSSVSRTLTRKRRHRTRTHTGSSSVTNTISIPSFTSSWSQTISGSSTLSLSMFTASMTLTMSRKARPRTPSRTSAPTSTMTISIPTLSSSWSDSSTMSLSAPTSSISRTLTRKPRHRTRTHTSSNSVTSTISIQSLTSSWSQTISESSTLSLSMFTASMTLTMSRKARPHRTRSHTSSRSSTLSSSWSESSTISLSAFTTSTTLTLTRKVRRRSRSPTVIASQTNTIETVSLSGSLSQSFSQWSSTPSLSGSSTWSATKGSLTLTRTLSRQKKKLRSRSRSNTATSSATFSGSLSATVSLSMTTTLTHWSFSESPSGSQSITNSITFTGSQSKYRHRAGRTRTPTPSTSNSFSVSQDSGSMSAAFTTTVLQKVRHRNSSSLSVSQTVTTTFSNSVFSASVSPSTTVTNSMSTSSSFTLRRARRFSGTKSLFTSTPSASTSESSTLSTSLSATSEQRRRTRTRFNGLGTITRKLPYRASRTPTLSSSSSASGSLTPSSSLTFTASASASSSFSSSITVTKGTGTGSITTLTLSPSGTGTSSLGPSALTTRKPAIAVAGLLEGFESNGSSVTQQRILTLLGDTFDRSVVNLSPGAPASPLNALPGGSSPYRPIGSCFQLSSSNEDLLSLIRGNATVVALNETALLLQVPSIPPESPLASWVSDETLTMEVSALCVKHRLPPKALLLRFIHAPRAPTPEVAVKRAQTAFAVTQIAGLAGGGGTMATAGARSTVVLGLFKCVPDFDDSLDFTDNPFQQRFGSGQDGEFLAAAILNPVLIYGLGVVHALIGYTYARYQGIAAREGLVWARFPSLSLIPLQYLVETTCGSAMLTLIYADDDDWHHRFAAVISLVLVLGLVIAVTVYLVRTWGAHLIPGEHPIQMMKARRQSRRSRDPFDDDFDQKGDRLRKRLSLAVTWVEYFIDSDSKWRDASKENPGYCRANRLLFMDYTEPNYWFMGVEIGVAALMGILGGIKLGPGRCGPVAVCIGLVLVVFLVLLFVRRPYCNLLDSYFNILVTVIQVGGALYTAAGLLASSDALYYRRQSELMTTIGLYLLIGKLILDILGVLKALAPKVKSLCSREPVVLPQNTDLTERLLETIQQEHVEDDIAHQGVSIEMIQRSERLEMEEEEEEDVLLLVEVPALKGNEPISTPAMLRTLPAFRQTIDDDIIEKRTASKKDMGAGSTDLFPPLPADHVSSKRYSIGNHDDDDGMDLLKRYYKVPIEEVESIGSDDSELELTDLEPRQTGVDAGPSEDLVEVGQRKLLRQKGSNPMNESKGHTICVSGREGGGGGVGLSNPGDSKHLSKILRRR